MKYDCLLWSHLSWHFFLLIVWNIDVVWWMNLTDGWCENNFNKQSQWCHNGKLIQTPDKCPSRLRQARGVGVKVWKFVPVSGQCDQWSPQCVSPLSSQSVLTEHNTGGRLFIATKLSCHFETPGTFHWKPLNNEGFTFLGLIPSAQSSKVMSGRLLSETLLLMSKKVQLEGPKPTAAPNSKDDSSF